MLEQEIKWSKAGMNLILHRSDVTLFRRGLHENLTAIRSAVGNGEATQTPKDIII